MSRVAFDKALMHLKHSTFDAFMLLPKGGHGLLSPHTLLCIFNASYGSPRGLLTRRLPAPPDTSLYLRQALHSISAKHFNPSPPDIVELNSGHRSCAGHLETPLHRGPASRHQKHPEPESSHIPRRRAHSTIPRSRLASASRSSLNGVLASTCT